MKPYTKASNIFTANNYKYPITSVETGNTYEIVIYPYRMDEEKYLEGCFVTLRKKGKLFFKQVCNMRVENEDGKISIAYINYDNMIII